MTGGVDDTRGLSYFQKGWTSFEYRLALMIKIANDAHASSWPQLLDLQYAAGDTRRVQFSKLPPAEPLAFCEGHTYGEKVYTSGADRDAIVAPKFKEATFQLLGGVEELSFEKNRWGDDEMRSIAAVLPLCGKLRSLDLAINGFGPESARVLAAATGRGALAQVETLSLRGNRIAAEGAVALAEAIGAGALLKLQWLDLVGNGIGDVGLEALAKASLAEGALSALTRLSLNYANKLTPRGIGALAEAGRGGAMKALKTLEVGENKTICNEGAQLMAGALKAGAFPSCIGLSFMDCGLSDTGVAALAASRDGLSSFMMGHVALGDCSALAAALSGGALPVLSQLWLAESTISDAGCAALAAALDGGAVPRLQTLNMGAARKDDPVLKAACAKREDVDLK